MRFSFIICAILLWPSITGAVTVPKKSPEFKSYRGISSLFLSPQKKAAQILKVRPNKTNETQILRHDEINSINEDESALTLCHDVNPHSHRSWANQAGRAARIVSKHGGKNIEDIRIQPQFSGLKGPTLSIMRKDLENLLVHKNGSPAEIFHNSKQASQDRAVCANRFKIETDTEYRVQYDFFDSDKAPLYRIQNIGHARAHLGRNFMGSLGVKFLEFEIF